MRSYTRMNWLSKRFVIPSDSEGSIHPTGLSLMKCNLDLKCSKFSTCYSNTRKQNACHILGRSYAVAKLRPVNNQ
ncbi:MAG: hypothetical protein JWR50_2858 [Mucilaginibacter sp.]|nr:hypothetical protein [Mucilaginibacter sp.]